VFQALGRLVRDHVRPQKHQDGNPREGQSARRQVRLQHRPADHQRIQQQPNQEEQAHPKQPGIAKMDHPVHAAVQAVEDHQQPGREEDQPQQVQIAQAEEAVELEVDADRQQGRQVGPRRRVELVFEEDVLHGLWCAW